MLIVADCGLGEEAFPTQTPYEGAKYSDVFEVMKFSLECTFESFKRHCLCRTSECVFESKSCDIVIIVCIRRRVNTEATIPLCSLGSLRIGILTNYLCPVSWLF